VCVPQNFFVHDESAHPHVGEDHVGLAHSTMMEWVRKIEGNMRTGNGAFLPLERNTARGVAGRRAPSSGGVVIILLTGVVLLVLVGATACDYLVKRRTNGVPFEKVAAA
jgi:hypothetical protein